MCCSPPVKSAIFGRIAVARCPRSARVANALAHTNSTMNTMLRQMPLYTHSTQATSARHVHAHQARCRAGAPEQKKLQQQHSRLQDLQDALSSEQEQGAGPQPLSRVVQELSVTNEIMQVTGAGFCESCAVQHSHTAPFRTGSTGPCHACRMLLALCQAAAPAVSQRTKQRSRSARRRNRLASRWV